MLQTYEWYVHLFQHCFNTNFVNIFKRTISETVCPVLEVNNGISSYDICLPDKRCQVGTTLHYGCEAGFDIASPETTCQYNHTWSDTPTCIGVKGMGSILSSISFKGTCCIHLNLTIRYSNIFYHLPNGVMQIVVCI